MKKITLGLNQASMFINKSDDFRVDQQYMFVDSLARHTFIGRIDALERGYFRVTPLSENGEEGYSITIQRSDVSRHETHPAGVKRYKVYTYYTVSHCPVCGSGHIQWITQPLKKEDHCLKYEYVSFYDRCKDCRFIWKNEIRAEHYTHGFLRVRSWWKSQSKESE